MLLVGYHDDDVYGEDDNKVRVGAMLVLDVVDVAAIARRGSLNGANLSGANLSGANLSRAYGTESTTLPAGWTVNASGLVVKDPS